MSEPANPQVAISKLLETGKFSGSTAVSMLWTLVLLNVWAGGPCLQPPASRLPSPPYPHKAKSAVHTNLLESCNEAGHLPTGRRDARYLCVMDAERDRPKSVDLDRFRK